MIKVYAVDSYYEIIYENQIKTQLPLGLIFQVDRDELNKEYFTKKIAGERHEINFSNPAILQYVLNALEKANPNLLILPIKNIFTIDMTTEINLDELSEANIRNIIAALLNETDKQLLNNYLMSRKG